MNKDMFLQLKGIDGEAQDDVYKDWIDVLAWSWGASQSGTTHIGGGSGAGKASIGDLIVTTYVNSASPKLMQHLFSGKHISEGELVIRKAGDKPLEYLKYKLKDVMITQYDTNTHNSEDDRLTESFTLNFATIKVVYTPQKADGSGGAGIEAGWDIPANKTLV